MVSEVRRGLAGGMSKRPSSVEWNRLLVQVEGNERDLTTLGLAGITHGQKHYNWESILPERVFV